MSATQILLADAVTAVINAAVDAEEYETLGFTARRSYPDWDDEFKDIDSLKVDVVFVASNGSNGELHELDSEGTLNSEPAVDIAIRKRFATSDRETAGASTGRLKNSAVDPLVRLVEQIHESVATERIEPTEIATGLYANWIDASVRTHCDYKRLREGVFLGVVRVRFDVSKAV